MGLPIYTCEDSFPSCIPAALATLGQKPKLTITPKEDRSEASCYYGYVVKRGIGRICISGSKDYGVMNVWIACSTLNPVRWRSSGRLVEDATRALQAAGIVERTSEEFYKMTSEFMEEKWAEQYVDANPLPLIVGNHIHKF